MSLAAEIETIALGPQQNGIGMTPQEFDDDYRYELIHGVLIVNPPPVEQEQALTKSWAIGS